MTREEAIQYAEKKLDSACYRLEMGYLNNGLRQIVSNEYEFFRRALSALRQQECVGEANKALTLDELRKMDGEPVWVVWPDGRIKSKWWIVNSGWWMDMFWDDHGNISNDYGTVWVAYRQKPEEGTV